MRWTTAFDHQLRKAHITLLVFAGLTTASGGLVSIGNIQATLLKNYPALLESFPQYKQYFALSTWIGLFGGFLFVLYPAAISVWISRMLVPISLLYLILGAVGITGFSHVAFNVCYWTVVVVALGTQLSGVKFFFKYTRLDGPILLILAVATAVWATHEYLKAPALGG